MLNFVELFSYEINGLNIINDVRSFRNEMRFEYTKLFVHFMV